MTLRPSVATVVFSFLSVVLACNTRFCAAQEEPKRPPYVHVRAIPFGGNWYLWFSDQVTYEFALQKARAMRGKLLEIDSKEENAFAKSHTKAPTWLGFRRTETFQWITQDGKVVFDYFNWAPGQPELAPNETYAAIYADGQWRDHLPSRLCYCIEWKGAPEER